MLERQCCVNSVNGGKVCNECGSLWRTRSFIKNGNYQINEMGEMNESKHHDFVHVPCRAI